MFRKKKTIRMETTQETALRQWADTLPDGPSYYRISGAIHAVVATAVSDEDLQRSPLALLRVDAPAEVQEWAQQVVQDIANLDESTDPLATVPGMAQQADFMEWMAGLGAVAFSRPEPFWMVFSARRDALGGPVGRVKSSRQQPLVDLANELMMVMALTPAECLPEGVGAEAIASLAQARDSYASAPEWDEKGRREVVLESLSALNTAFATMHMMDDPKLQEIVAREMGDGGTVRREGRKIRPNEPCPCGSGKKYKKCHGAPGAGPLP